MVELRFIAGGKLVLSGEFVGSYIGWILPNGSAFDKCSLDLFGIMGWPSLCRNGNMILIWTIAPPSGHLFKSDMFALRILGHLEHILSSICSLIRWRRKWKWWRDLKTEVCHQTCHQKRSSPKVDRTWSTWILFLGKTSFIINSQIEGKRSRYLRQYFLQFLGSPNV